MENKKAVPGIVYVDGRDKTPNEKMYLILLSGECEGVEFRDYEWKVGRQAAYDYIKDMIENDEDTYIDIHESKIISESVNILDAISIYEFMKLVKEAVIDETGFDIEEYNIEGEIGIETPEE